MEKPSSLIPAHFPQFLTQVENSYWTALLLFREPFFSVSPSVLFPSKLCGFCVRIVVNLDMILKNVSQSVSSEHCTLCTWLGSCRYICMSALHGSGFIPYMGTFYRLMQREPFWNIIPGQSGQSHSAVKQVNGINIMVVCWYSRILDPKQLTQAVDGDRNEKLDKLSSEIINLVVFPYLQVWRGAPSWHGQRLLCTSAAPEGKSSRPHVLHLTCCPANLGPHSQQFAYLYPYGLYQLSGRKQRMLGFPLLEKTQIWSLLCFRELSSELEMSSALIRQGTLIWS